MARFEAFLDFICNWIFVTVFTISGVASIVAVLVINHFYPETISTDIARLFSAAMIVLMILPVIIDEIGRKILLSRVKHFPHSNSVLSPVQKFLIKGRWLYLYHCKDRTPSTSLSLYWEDELNPVQHAMNDLEVFAVLADLINPKEKK